MVREAKQNWPKSKLVEVEIGRSRNWPKSNWPNSKKKIGRSKEFRAHNSKGWTKKTQNVTWGSILTPSRKKLKTAENLKLDKNKAKNKMEFRTWTKMEQNMCCVFIENIDRERCLNHHFATKILSSRWGLDALDEYKWDVKGRSAIFRDQDSFFFLFVGWYSRPLFLFLSFHWFFFWFSNFLQDFLIFVRLSDFFFFLTFSFLYVFSLNVLYFCDFLHFFGFFLRTSQR